MQCGAETFFYCLLRYFWRQVIGAIPLLPQALVDNPRYPHWPTATRVIGGASSPNVRGLPQPKYLGAMLDWNHELWRTFSDCMRAYKAIAPTDIIFYHRFWTNLTTSLSLNWGGGIMWPSWLRYAYRPQVQAFLLCNDIQSNRSLHQSYFQHRRSHSNMNNGKRVFVGWRQWGRHSTWPDELISF